MKVKRDGMILRLVRLSLSSKTDGWVLNLWAAHHFALLSPLALKSAIRCSQRIRLAARSSLVMEKTSLVTLLEEEYVIKKGYWLGGYSLTLTFLQGFNTRLYIN